jgi:hypothetical protein
VASSDPIRTEGWEDTPWTFIAYVTRDNADNEVGVVQADVSAITVAVWDADRSVETLASTVVDKTTTVFNTPLTGSLWTEGAPGFNFKHRVPATAFPEPGEYRVEYLFTLTGNVTYPVVFIHTAKSLRRS